MPHEILGAARQGFTTDYFREILSPGSARAYKPPTQLSEGILSALSEIKTVLQANAVKTEKVVEPLDLSTMTTADLEKHVTRLDALLVEQTQKYAGIVKLLEGEIVLKLQKLQLQSADSRREAIKTVSAATSLMASAELLQSNYHSTAAEFRVAAEEYQKRIFQEAGCHEQKDLYEIRYSLVKEARQLKEPHRLALTNPVAPLRNVLAASANRKEIKGKENEIALVDIAIKKLREAPRYVSAFCSEFALEDVQRSFRLALGQTINEGVKALHSELVNLPSVRDVPPQLIDRIAQNCVAQFLPGLIKSKTYRDYDKLDTDAHNFLEQPLLVEAAAIFRLMFAKSSYESPDDSPQLLADRVEAKARLSKLPENISSAVQTMIDYSIGWMPTVESIVWIGMDPKFARQASDIRVALTKIQDTVSEINSITGYSDLYDVNYSPDNLPTDKIIKNCLLICDKELAVPAKCNDFIPLVQLTCEALDTTGLCTDITLEQAHEVIASLTYDTVVLGSIKNEDYVSAKNLGEYLYTCKYPNLVPVAILNAWASKQQGFLPPLRDSALVHSSSSWAVTSYLLHLPEETMRHFEKQGLPAVKTLHLLADIEAECWGLEKLNDVNGPAFDTPNPIYMQTVSAVEDIIVYVLRNGTTSEKLFACRACQQLNGASTEAGRKNFFEIIDEEKNLSVRNSLIDALITKGSGNHIDAPLLEGVLLHGEGALRPEHGVSIFYGLSKTGISKPDFERLAAVTGLSADHIANTLTFIKVVGGWGNEKNFDFSLPGDKSQRTEYFKNWVTAANQKDFSLFAEKLIHGGIFFLPNYFSEANAYFSKYPDATVAIASAAASLNRAGYELTFEDLKVLFSDKVQVNPATADLHATWIARKKSELSDSKQFSFIRATQSLSGLLSLTPEQLTSLRAGGYDSNFVFGVVSPLFARGNSSISIEQLRKTFPKTTAILNDRYQMEYLASYIDEKPDIQLPLISGVIGRGFAIQNGTGKTLLATMSLMNSISEPSFAQRLLEHLDSPDCQSVGSLYEKAMELAVQSLSTRYPKDFLKKLSPADLAEFVEVYSTYEKTLEHFEHPEKIPVLRVIAVTQLLNKEVELHNNDRDFFKELTDGIDTYFPNVTEHAAIQSYIAERLVDASPSMWIKPDEKPFEHVVGETSTEDKITSVKNILDTLIGANHISESLRSIEHLSPQTNRAKDLAALWQKTTDSAEKDRIKVEQLRLAEWKNLRTLVSTYEGKLNGFLAAYQTLRVEKLQPFAECIEALGFKFYDSFGRHIYRGEMKILEKSVEEMLKDEKTDFPYRKDLADVSKVLKQASKLDLDANNYLSNLASQAGEISKMLAVREARVTSILAEIPIGTSAQESCAIIQKHDVALGNYLAQRIAMISEESNKSAYIASELQKAGELTAQQDFIHIATLAKEATQQDGVWTYSRTLRFSKLLTAMVGQCLDYRSSKNSIGNSVFNVSLTDCNRSVIIAHDTSGSARLNSLCYLAPVKLAQQDEFTGFVLDIPYVSDGTALSKDKLLGLIYSAHATAADQKMPLIIPIRSIDEEVVKDAAIELHVAMLSTQGTITLLPGPSGSTYVEVEAFLHYDTVTAVSTKMVVLYPFAQD